MLAATGELSLRCADVRTLLMNAAGIRHLENGRFRMNRFVASWVPGCLSLLILVGVASAADGTGPAHDGSQPPATMEAIVVTGSYSRRTDTESPSPVDVINELAQGIQPLLPHIAPYSLESLDLIEDEDQPRVA